MLTFNRLQGALGGPITLLTGPTASLQPDWNRTPYNVKTPPPSRGPKSAWSALTSWATTSYGGLCTHSVTGQVQYGDGSPATAIGGLAPTESYPPCPIQTPPAPPNPAPPAPPPPWAPAPGQAPVYADAPVYAEVAPGVDTRKDWVPWVIGGGVLAAVGAAIVVFLNR